MSKTRNLFGDLMKNNFNGTEARRQRTEEWMRCGKLEKDYAVEKNQNRVVARRQ